MPCNLNFDAQNIVVWSLEGHQMFHNDFCYSPHKLCAVAYIHASCESTKNVVTIVVRTWTCPDLDRGPGPSRLGPKFPDLQLNFGAA